MSFGGRSGTNATPLGPRRRLKIEEKPSRVVANNVQDIDMGHPGCVVDECVNPKDMPLATLIEKPYEVSRVKRGRSAQHEVRVKSDSDVKRRRKANRWGAADENKVAGLMGLPTIILTPMTSEQLDAYAVHLRVEEITQKLKINDIVPPEGHRSPSPAPTYDNHGRRINTREYRYRKRLEDERHKLVQKAHTVFTNYHAPADYRRPVKTTEKIYVPVNDYPEINFIGLLIGPRGNTLKRMESESGAKIAIRGKGSVKEGKGASDRATDSNLDEDLHCLIIADTEAKIEMAKKAILEVIETAASIPEGQNTLKRNQLRELASLNGTLRDDENQACQNCGGLGHRKYECPEKRNFTSNIICRICGNSGHMARDCRDRQRGTDWRNTQSETPGDAVDREYDQLMIELAGDGASQRTFGPPGQQSLIKSGPEEDNYPGYSGPDRDTDRSKPWERGPTGGPVPWRDTSGRSIKTENHDVYRNERRDNPGLLPTGPSGGDRPDPPSWQQHQQRPARDPRPEHDDRIYNSGHTQSYPGNQPDTLPPWSRQNAQTRGYSAQQQMQAQYQQSYGYNANYYAPGNPYQQMQMPRDNYQQVPWGQHRSQQSYQTSPMNDPYNSNSYDQPPPPPPPEQWEPPPPPPPPPTSPPPPPPPFPPPPPSTTGATSGSR